jgi:outer membrane immunogenic protein
MLHRSLLIAGAAALAAALGAAAPAAAQDYDWTGFYVGGNLGGTWGDTDLQTVGSSGGGAVVIPPADLAMINATGSQSANKTGFTGGVEGGYNFQAGSWLFGVETDYGAMDVNQSQANTYQSAVLITPPVTYTLTQRVSTDWVWTLRGRLGYVSGPWMFYGTGGMATTKIKFGVDYADTRATPSTAHIDVNDTKSGWTAGLGGAFMFAPQLSAKAEWLYADFGNVRGSATTSNGFASFTSEAGVKANLVRVGLDWTF